MTRTEPTSKEPEWVPRSRFERERAARRRAEELLESMSRRLYDGQKARERFIKNINHEFRTPINGILGPAQLLRDSRHSAEVRAFAAAIETCATELFEMIETSIAAAEIDRHLRQETVHDRPRPVVLVVDDNAINRMVVKASLEALNMTVLQAENGAEALDMLPEYRPDAVLLDIQMPVMDGAAALRAIRTCDAEWRSVPVVILTADAEADAQERYRAMGANAYMTKPIVIRRLQNLLCQLIPGFRAETA